MDTLSDMMEPATPVLSCDGVNYCRTEDSGYHTFTPGSIDCSELSSENIDPVIVQASVGEGKGNHHRFYNNTPEPCYDLTNFSDNNENYPERIKRRGVKRPYQNDTEANDSFGSIPTPTSIIAGQIQKLKVNESGNYSGNYSISPISSNYTDASSLYNFNACSWSFPSTPIKKVCKSSCKLNRIRSNHKSSPLRPLNINTQQPKKFARQLDFETHSLACEPQSLILINIPPPSSPAPVLYKPNQRIDIIKLLSDRICSIPVIDTILSFMSPADIFNFSLVSPTWSRVCGDSCAGREKLKTYLRLSKENQENKRSSPKLNITDIRRKLRDIHNIEHLQTTPSSPRSPPTSPRSMRFKTFARSASLDVCIQLACVRCQQPAKVTKDPSGEIWASCTRATCAYQFCKLCSCDRHPGKSCIRFDLEGPSPSKRKKKTCAAGSRQSKTNLRRLLIK
ncbi:uncharacterized protein LOC125225098 [Leguminivora glycinivorella]|uniref:uncharacterized protein LOC125225098 n=1 Tax=Leguminivora glycinivorella TaxID=1035111 RepID=UPI002010290F|nr:uncharacterized protein LOC125225098 [Leguminivora glycinivorella]